MLFNFAFSSYRQRVISKHQTLLFTCVSITDNLKLTTTFLTMKTLIWKFQILIHSNNFKISIFFSHILVMFSEKIWLNFLKMNSLNCFKNPCRKSPYFTNVTQTLIPATLLEVGYLTKIFQSYKRIFVLILAAVPIATPTDR